MIKFDSVVVFRYSLFSLIAIGVIGFLSSITLVEYLPESLQDARHFFIGEAVEHSHVSALFSILLPINYGLMLYAALAMLMFWRHGRFLFGVSVFFSFVFRLGIDEPTIEHSITTTLFSITHFLSGTTLCLSFYCTLNERFSHQCSKED